MHTSILSFRARADVALTDPALKVAIDRTTGTAERKRAAALAAFPQFDAARDRGKRIKDHVIEHFDHYLLEFERNAIASGAKVQIGKSGKFCGQSAVQMHGGMGVTDELSVSHYFKRLTMIDLMFGNQQHHLTRYSNLAMAA